MEMTNEPWDTVDFMRVGVSMEPCLLSRQTHAHGRTCVNIMSGVAAVVKNAGVVVEGSLHSALVVWEIVCGGDL